MTSSCCVRRGKRPSGPWPSPSGFSGRNWGSSCIRRRRELCTSAKASSSWATRCKQGTGHRLPASKRRGRPNPQNLYAIPREKSVQRFQEQIRSLTRRKAPLKLREVIERINPGDSRLGALLPQGGCETALPSAGPVDRASPLLVPGQALAESDVATVSHSPVDRGVRFGATDTSHPRSRPTMTPGRSSRGKRLAGKLHEPFDRADRGRAFTPHLFRLYRRSDTDTRRNPHGRTRNPPCKSKEQGTETLGLHGFEAGGLPPLKARTVPRKGRAGEEESCRVERRQGIREAARAAPGRSRG